MKHLPAVLIKLAFIVAISYAVLVPWVGATPAQALGVGVFITVILYLIGDLVLLPAMGNAPAAAIDAGKALVLAWLAPVLAGVPGVTLGQALVLGLMVGTTEFLFFHALLLREGVPGRVRRRRR